MAILDKLIGVGEAVRDKVKETFGDPQDGLTLDDDDEADAAAPESAPLDVPAAYAAVGLGDGATLADVREAYRALAHYHHPIARRDGPESESARAMDRLLESLELLEEHLVPLGAAAGGKSAPPPPRRKRATARAR